MFRFKAIIKNLAVFISSTIIFLSISHSSLGETNNTSEKRSPVATCLNLPGNAGAQNKKACEQIIDNFINEKGQSECREATKAMDKSRGDFNDACDYKSSTSDSCIAFHKECKQEDASIDDDEDAEDRLNTIMDMADECPLKLAMQKESFKERAKELKEDLKSLEKEVDETKKDKNDIRKECDEKDQKIKEDLADLEKKKKEEEANFNKALENATQEVRDQYAQLDQRETQFKTQIEANKERILDAERIWLLDKFAALEDCQNYAAIQYSQRRQQVEQRLAANKHIVNRQTLMNRVGLSKNQIRRLKSDYDYQQCTRNERKGVKIPANVIYLRKLRLAQLKRTRTVTSANIAMRNLIKQLSSITTQKANLSQSLLKNNQNLAKRYANEIKANSDQYNLIKGQEVKNGAYCQAETDRLVKKLKKAEERSKARARIADLQDDIDGFIANRNLPSAKKAEELRKAISTHFADAIAVFAACDCSSSNGKRTNGAACNYVCTSKDFAEEAGYNCDTPSESESVLPSNSSPTAPAAHSSNSSSGSETPAPATPAPPPAAAPPPSRPPSPPQPTTTPVAI